MADTALNDTSIRISTEKIPFGVQLMPHQKAMLYKMILLENENVGTDKSYSMMSDKPGAGKTYAILSMVYFMDKILFQGRRKHVTLIVVPYNICTQWMQSMERLYGTSGRLMTYRVLTEYSHIMSLYTDPTQILRNDIILTTSLYFHNIASTLESLKIVLRRVFFDEADSIKNLLQTPLKTKMTWFVSASMESLFNGSASVRIGEYNLSMEHLKQNNVHSAVEFVNSNIVLEQPMVHKIECKNVYYNLLIDIMPPKVHERLAAMDYTCLRSEYYRMSRSLGSEYDACAFMKCENIAKYESCTTLLKQYEYDYKELIKRLMKKQATELEHRMNAVKREIQECERRTSVIKYFCSQYDIMYETRNDTINDSIFECKGKPNESKLEKLIETLQHITLQNKRAQCLVFTNYDNIYTLLFPHLDKLKISYKFLDGGNIADMDTVIQAYKRHEFSVLLADSSMYSCGMNLENTSDVIFVHEMEPLREKQIIGRAQRYGRDGMLNVWYFTYTKHGKK